MVDSSQLIQGGSKVEVCYPITGSDSGSKFNFAAGVESGQTISDTGRFRASV